MKYCHRIAFAKFLRLGFIFYFAQMEIADCLGQSGGAMPSMELYLFPKSVQLSQKSIEELKGATAVEIDIEGNIYIANSKNDRIIKFGTTQQILSRTAGWGHINDQLNNPTDIALNSGLNIIVADYVNGRIVRLDRDLNFISDRRLNNIDSEYEYPLSIALSNWGDLYILEERTRKILHLQPAMPTVNEFGGFRAGSYGSPGASKLAVDGVGNVYAAVPKEKSIIVFDRYGNFLYEKDIEFQLNTLDCEAGYIWFAGGDRLGCIQKDRMVNVNHIKRNIQIKNIIDIAFSDGLLVILAENPPYLWMFQVSKSPAGIEW